MRTTAGFVLAALSIGEAIASPVAHAHLHQRAHEKKDVDYSALDWNNMGIDWSSAYEAGQATKTSSAVAVVTAGAVQGAALIEKPATTTTAAVVKTTESASSSAAKATATSTSSGSDTGLLNNVKGVSNDLNAFGSASTKVLAVGDSAVNNYGTPYGSNIIKVSSTTGYDFTTNFINSQSVPITVNIWNKVGPDLQPLSGPMLAPKQTTLTFALPAGGSQIVAFMDNTNAAFAQATNNLRSDSGQFDTTIGEVTFLTSGSGYDVSAIPNSQGNNYDMSITSTQSSCVSDMNQNMWLTATDPVGTSDGSCFISQSTATLTVTLGGAK